MNIAHPSLAKEGKSSVYEAIQTELRRSSINNIYGVDKNSWEVWPVNTSPLAQNVQKDLEKQVNLMINQFRNQAQQIERQSIHVKGTVDQQYVEFTRGLTPEQLNYLKGVQVQRTFGNYATDKKEIIDVTIATGGK